MDQKIGRKILDIHSRARREEWGRPLLAEYEEAGARLMALLPEMTNAQQSAVMDYIGVFGALHLKLLELALAEELSGD